MFGSHFNLGHISDKWLQYHLLLFFIAALGMFSQALAWKVLYCQLFKTFNVNAVSVNLDHNSLSSGGTPCKSGVAKASAKRSQ